MRLALMVLGVCGGCLLGTAATVVDFGLPAGRIRPQLHSAGLGKAKVVSVEALNDQLDLETVSLPTETAENTSRTPFSPAVASPVFTRDGDTFTFHCWTPTSAAWLITF